MRLVTPLTIGLWDPFQMAFSWLINGGDPNHLRPSWDGPPSSPPKKSVDCFGCLGYVPKKHHPKSWVATDEAEIY